MQILNTISFKLATISEGDINATKVAICLPGRLDTKDYINFTRHLEYLSQRGFYALSFDPPGTWQSPGSSDLFTTTNYIKAVNEMIDLLGNRPTLLLGHSRGGVISAYVGTDNPHVTGIIGINESFRPPSPPDAQTLETGTYKDHRDLPPGDKRTENQRQFMMGLGYFEDGAGYDDAEKLMACTKPKLIIYSKDDEFNTPEDVKRVYDSLPDPKELHEVSGTHDYRLYPEVIDEANEVIGKFLEKFKL